MGRVVPRIRAITDSVAHDVDFSDYRKVRCHEVYWSNRNGLIFIPSQEWRDYLYGKTDEMPAEPEYLQPTDEELSSLFAYGG